MTNNKKKTKKNTTSGNNAPGGRNLRSSTSTRNEENDSLRELGIDIESIQSTILARVNQSMAANSSAFGSVAGSATPTTDTLKTFLDQILPAIVTSVAMAVGQVMSTALERHRATEETSANVEVKKLQRRMTLLRFENDKLEQYGRRETIRIVGMKEEKGENVEQKVIELFKEAGASVAPDDISVTHRTGMGKRRSGPRHVLVRFVSRRKKREVMMARKNLKGKDQFKDVFINDDLTAMRSRLLGYVKGSQRFGRVWSSDGKILCLKKLPTGAQRDPQERPLVIDTADDLFNVGFDTVDLVKLGLQDWYVPCVDDDDDDDDSDTN